MLSSHLFRCVVFVLNLCLVGTSSGKVSIIDKFENRYGCSEYRMGYNRIVLTVNSELIKSFLFAPRADVKQSPPILHTKK